MKILYFSVLIINFSIITILLCNKLTETLRTIQIISNTNIINSCNILISNYQYSLSENSAIIMLIIIILSSIITLWIFSIYLEYDVQSSIFTLKLVIFLFTVIASILANDILLLLLLWECIGWTSFKLIGHWIDRNLTQKGSYIAIMYNRLGDQCILIGVATIYNSISSNNNVNQIEIIWILLLIGMFMKSIIGITAMWLPEAMEGPTPVSSFLHSCTLVKSGIYIIIKCSLDVDLFMIINNIIWLGILTILSKQETDAKRIVAYSTVIILLLLWIFNILGMTGCCYEVSIIHAAYKCAIFANVGRMISINNWENSDTLFSKYNSANNNILLLLTIALVEKNNIYNISKHSIQLCNIEWIIGMDIFLQIGIISIWVLCFKILTNIKAKNWNAGFTDLIIIIIIGSNLIIKFLLAGIFSNIEETSINLLLSLLYICLANKIMILQLGSNMQISSIIQIYTSMFNIIQIILKFIFIITKIQHFQTIESLLFGILIILLFI